MKIFEHGKTTETHGVFLGMEFRREVRIFVGGEALLVLLPSVLAVLLYLVPD